MLFKMSYLPGYSYSSRKKIIMMVITLIVLICVSLTNTKPNMNMVNTDVVVCVNGKSSVSKTIIEIGSHRSLEGNLISVSDFKSCASLLKWGVINSTENIPLSFILIPSSMDNLVAELLLFNNISMDWKKNVVRHRLWLPTVFILWPETDTATATATATATGVMLTEVEDASAIQDLILQTHPFQDGHQSFPMSDIFSVDSQVYIVKSSPSVIGAQVDVNKITAGLKLKQTRLTVLDVYYINSQLVVQKILSETNNVKTKTGLSFGQDVSSTVEYYYDSALPRIFSLMGNVGRNSFIARRNFHQLPLRVVGFSKGNKINVASFDYEQINETHIRFTGGYSVNLLRDLSDGLNFTVIAYEDHSITRLDKEKRIVGTGKRIVEDDFDLSIALLSIVPWRAKYMDFLQPFHPELANVFFQQPPSSVVRNIFISPFQTMTWITLGVFQLIILVAIILTKKIHQMRLIQENQCTGVANSGSSLDFGEVLMSLICITSLQGWREVPNSKVARIILLSGIFLSWTLFVCYSASILSALALRETPVTELSHFFQYGYKLVATESAFLYYKSLPNNPETKHVLQGTEKYYVNPNHTMTKILEHGSRFASVSAVEEHYYIANLMNISRQELCKLSSFPLGPRTSAVSMVIQKGSPYKQFLNTKTILSFERGLGHVQKMRFHDNIPGHCQLYKRERIEKDFQDLSFPDSKLMFIIILGGVLLSILFLMAENILMKLQRKTGIVFVF